MSRQKRATKPQKRAEFIDENDPFRQLIRAWILSCKSNGLSTETINDYQDKAFKFWWWWAIHTHHGATHPNQVTIEDVEAFSVYLRTPIINRWGAYHPRQSKTGELSAATIADHGRAPKIFFNWLKRRKYVSDNPFVEVTFTGHTKTIPPKPLSQANLAKILNLYSEDKSFLGLRNHAMLSVLIDTAIRIGELHSLTIGNTDLKSGVLLVSGKTGPRSVVIEKACKKAIAEYLKVIINDADNDPLWQCEDGRQLAYRSIEIMLRRVSERTKVKFHAHLLRHTSATHLAERGMGIYDLKNYLGHKNISTTEIYLHGSMQHRADVHSKFSPLNELKAATSPKRGRAKRIKG